MQSKANIVIVNDGFERNVELASEFNIDNCFPTLILGLDILVVLQQLWDTINKC